MLEPVARLLCHRSGAIPRRAVLAGLLLSLATACGSTPAVVILLPLSGTFTTDPSVQVTGLVVNVDPASIADVRVNGVSVLPLAMDQSFTTTVTLDTEAIVNPIVAEVIGHGGTILRHRITVMAGDSVADGDFSPEGLALRLNDAGLDEIEPQVASLVPLDLATLVPPGTLVVDNYCYQDSIFGCIGRIDATISGSPPPSIGSFAVDVDSMTNFVGGDITLFELFFRANVVAVSGIGFSCTVDVTAATTLIVGDYALEPQALDPEQIDVTQLGGVSVSFGNFNDSTNCAGFLGGIVEFFIDLFVSDLQNDLVRPGLENFLDTVDVDGNTPVAAALETTLEAIEIAGPIGQAIGVNLEAPLFAISEDVDGVTWGSDARITALMPDPAAVDLAESYHVTQAFPSFGPLSPNGMPYELGACISTSAFNQLLKAEIESGLLIQSITEFDFGGGPVPITAGLLEVLVPEMAFLDPAEALQVDLFPMLAPIVTGQAGPAGELATLKVPHLRLRVAPVADPTVALLEVVVDATLGLDADVIAGELTFLISAPAVQDLNTTILENPLFVSEASLDALLPGFLTLAFPALTDSLGTFPLPDFLGLELSQAQVDLNGEFISLFLNLSPAP